MPFLHHNVHLETYILFRLQTVELQQSMHRNIIYHFCFAIGISCAGPYPTQTLLA